MKELSKYLIKKLNIEDINTSQININGPKKFSAAVYSFLEDHDYFFMRTHDINNLGFRIGYGDQYGEPTLYLKVNESKMKQFLEDNQQYSECFRKCSAMSDKPIYEILLKRLYREFDSDDIKFSKFLNDIYNNII